MPATSWSKSVADTPRGDSALTFLSFQVKRFQFFLALLALLAPTGSWAAWPGECTKIIAAGTIINCLEPSGCSGAINLRTVTINANGSISVTSAGLIGFFHGESFNGAYRTYYFENGSWHNAGSSGSVNTNGIQLDAEFNVPEPPTGTCGSPTDLPKNLGPPCSFN